jgi:hypothetical protein
VFWPLHEVLELQLLPDGTISTTCIKRTQKVEHTTKGVKMGPEQKQATVKFISKAVILSHGGKQVLHPDFKTQFPSIPSDKIILSDYFLRAKSVPTVFNQLKSNKLKKVAILGGSSSAFSCAWLLLNGPSLPTKPGVLMTKP